MASREVFSMYDYVRESCLLEDSDDIQERQAEMAKMGFLFEERDAGTKLSFDPNIFAQYMKKCVVAVRDETDNIYLYHRTKGVYTNVREEMLGSLCMELMNQIDTMWSTNREKVGLQAFRRKVTVTIKRFSEPNWLNLKNGLFNLKKMELEPHSHKKVTVTQLPIVYDQDADCPRFKQFMEEITGGNKRKCFMAVRKANMNNVSNGPHRPKIPLGEYDYKIVYVIENGRIVKPMVGGIILQ